MNSELSGKVLVTGGAGTLGTAFVSYAKERKWTCDITVFSTDPMKHVVLKKLFPDVNCVMGDIRSYDVLFNAIAGHDIVLHAAATKYIPVSERDTLDTLEVNVAGTLNVFKACVQAGIKKCIGVSTDKAAHPASLYGMTKAMGERMLYEYSRSQSGTEFYMPRLGNMIDSTGSVLQIWQRQRAEGKPITFTDPAMTRFWITPKQAVEVIVSSLNYPGSIYVPRLPALSIKKVADYTIGEDVPREVIGLRPGEQVHEELLTIEESAYAAQIVHAYIIRDVTGPRCNTFGNYSSDKPVRELTREEIRSMMGLE